MVHIFTSMTIIGKGKLKSSESYFLTNKIGMTQHKIDSQLWNYITQKKYKTNLPITGLAYDNLTNLKLGCFPIVKIL